jgi:hypothetical protein
MLCRFTKFIAAGGVLESDTRTSSNTWLRRTPGMMDTLYKRAAAILGVGLLLITYRCAG